LLDAGGWFLFDGGSFDKCLLLLRLAFGYDSFCSPTLRLSVICDGLYLLEKIGIKDFFNSILLTLFHMILIEFFKTSDN